MKYDECQKKHPTISWSSLTVYYAISRFERIKNEYFIEGSKVAENYKGQRLDYSREFPLEAEPGYLKDCQIIIPLKDSYESENGKIAWNNGYFKLNKVEFISSKTIFIGEFYHSQYGCRGTVNLFSD
ncbi:MAG: hypothetical protein ACK4TA_21460 [Saprospiraceae bacterium]